MIDTLVPAVAALRETADAGATAAAAIQAAATAAATGAESTKAMQARFGRARNIKEQSIGTQDPRRHINESDFQRIRGSPRGIVKGECHA